MNNRLTSSLAFLIGVAAGMLCPPLILHACITALIGFFSFLPDSLVLVFFSARSYAIPTGILLFICFTILGPFHISDTRKTRLTNASVVLAALHTQVMCLREFSSYHVFLVWWLLSYCTLIWSATFLFLWIDRDTSIRKSLFCSSVCILLFFCLDAYLSIREIRHSPLRESAWKLSGARYYHMDGSSCDPYTSFKKRRHPPIIYFGKLPVYLMIYPCNRVSPSFAYGGYLLGYRNNTMDMMTDDQLSEDLNAS